MCWIHFFDQKVLRVLACIEIDTVHQYSIPVKLKEPHFITLKTWPKNKKQHLAFNIVVFWRGKQIFSRRHFKDCSCYCLVARLCPPLLWPHGLYVVCQAPLSMAFPRQEYWSGLLFPSPGDFSEPGIEPTSSALLVDSLPLSHLGRLLLKTLI